MRTSQFTTGCLSGPPTTERDYDAAHRNAREVEAWALREAERRHTGVAFSEYDDADLSKLDDKQVERLSRGERPGEATTPMRMFRK